MQACADLLNRLKGLAVMKFGAVLSDSVALSALEVSRHLPGAHGWPSAEGALGCLQAREDRTPTAPSALSHTPTVTATAVAPNLSHSRSQSANAPPSAPPFEASAPHQRAAEAFLASLSSQTTAASEASLSQSQQTPANPTAPRSTFTTPSTSSSFHASGTSTLSPVRLFPGNDGRSAGSPLIVTSPPINFQGTPHLSSQNRTTTSNSAPTPSTGGSVNSTTSSQSALASALAERIMAGMGLTPAPPLHQSPPPNPFAGQQPAVPATDKYRGLLGKANAVRRAFSEGKAVRAQGNRLTMEDGSDAELATPLALASDIDAFLQQRLLDVATTNLFLDAAPGAQGVCPDQSRRGISEAAFESARNQASMELSPVVAEATGADTSEVLQAMANNEADASIALLTILHSKGDGFQQACAHAAAVELQQRRKERSLAKIVEEAARQGNLPADLSCKRILRNLQNHLPLTEIMGHRYRTNPEASRVAFANTDADNSSRSARPAPRSSRGGADNEEDSSDADSDSDGIDDGDDVEDDDDSDSDYSDRRSDRVDSESGGDTSSEEFSGDTSDSGASMSSRSSRSSRHSSRGKGKKRHSSRDRRHGSNLVAAPPPNWNDGDAPNGGYFLETFTKIYQQYRSFKKMHKGTGLLFRDLVQPDIEPTLLMECQLTEKQYKSLSQDDLLSTIKQSLGFSDDDYFTRQLELLKLQNCKKAKATELYKAFRKLTTPFLRILKEAKDSGVVLRNSNVVRIFKNQIKGVPAFERWFHTKKFKTFNSALQHISGQLRERISKEIEELHYERISAGEVAGARSDCQGGKSESGQAGRFPARGARNDKRPATTKRNDFQPNKKHNDGGKGGSGSRYPQRSESEETAFQAALQKEKELPNGMYFHPRGPFCTENPCRAKVCQGCNFHADSSGKGHIRPNCRCKAHSDYVATGYFHEKWPNRTGALALPGGRESRKSGHSNHHQFSAPPSGQVRNTSGQRLNRDKGDSKE